MNTYFAALNSTHSVHFVRRAMGLIIRCVHWKQKSEFDGTMLTFAFRRGRTSFPGSAGEIPARKWLCALVKVSHKTERTCDNVSLWVFHFNLNSDKSWNTMISRVSLYESRTLSVSLRETSATRENARLEYFYFIPKRVRQSGGRNWKGRPGLFINDRARFHCAFPFFTRERDRTYILYQDRGNIHLLFFLSPPSVH